MIAVIQIFVEIEHEKIESNNLLFNLFKIDYW